MKRKQAFKFQLKPKDKLPWNGGMLITVPPENTSRTCPECGHVAAENRPNQARFCCVQCGYEAHADLVAAINIRRAGHTRMACGSNGSSRRKQEPTEVVQVVARATVGIPVLQGGEDVKQHRATPEQIDAGVFEPRPDIKIPLGNTSLSTLVLHNILHSEPKVDIKETIASLLTFNDIPTRGKIKLIAETLAAIAKAHGVTYVMIGGAPFLMSALEEALKSRNMVPLYAFSKRVVVEQTMPDGTVRKETVFKHEGFVEV